MHLHRMEASNRSGHAERPRRSLARWLRCQRGASAIEYALLLALIAALALSAVSYFGTSTAGNLKRSGDCLAAADGSQPHTCRVLLKLR